MICPRCRTAMSTVVRDTPYDRIELDVCPRCQGVWFDMGELAAALQLQNLSAFAPDSPLLEGDRVTLPCPRDPSVRMHERYLAIPVEDTPHKLRLEQCADCGGVFLDGGELPEIVAAAKHKRAQPFLENPDTARMGSIALWLFMFATGLPIEQWNPRVRRPVVMPLLVIACIVVFGWQVSGGPDGMEATVQNYGMIPRLLFLGAWPTLLTSIFLHGGVAHLLGNMYFLWVFGDNVEDRLGRLRFLALYLLSGVAAGLCHALVETDKTLPVVGASGAISGVMAAYAVLFPKRRLISLIFFFRVRWTASLYLFGWLGFQILGALMHQQGIAWWAHIGGFIVGALMAWRLRPAALAAPQTLTSRAAV